MEETPIRFLVERMKAIVDDPKSTNRDKFTAARLILQASKRRARRFSKKKEEIKDPMVPKRSGLTDLVHKV